MTISIRAAQSQDLDFLADMNRLVHELHVAAAPAIFKPHERSAVIELFESRLANENIRVWIGCVGEEPAGYAVAVVHDQLETALTLARRYVVIDDVCVSPAHRRQGVARALIEHVIVQAREEGLREVQLSTWSFNADAQAAFQAIGFQPMTVRFQRESR